MIMLILLPLLLAAFFYSQKKFMKYKEVSNYFACPTV